MLILIALTGGTATGAAAGLTGYVEKGTVSGDVSIDIADDSIVVYYRGKLARTPVGEEVNQSWETVDLESDSKYSPSDFWGITLGGEPILFQDRATLDVRDIEPGEYALFLWGCDTGGVTPQDCRWLQPRLIEVEAATACEAEGYTCLDPQARSLLGAPPEVQIEDREFACDASRQCVEFVSTCDPRPTVSIFEPYELRAGEMSEFSAIASDCDGSIESYEWTISRFNPYSTDMGRVAPPVAEYTGQEITHTFNDDGRYTVQVTVEDDDGNTVPQSEVVSVDGPALDIPDGLIASSHRGGNLAPENTIAAFESTREVGLNGVEFDVRKADDGFVVIHDKNTQRTTGQDHKVSDTSLDTLTSLSADSDYSARNLDDLADPQYEEYVVPDGEASEVTVPSFEETLEYFQDHEDMWLRIELKGELRGNGDLAGELYEMVEDHGLTDRSIFMSFSGDCSPATDVGWHTINPFDHDSTIVRDCTYGGLEGIEDASDGGATTAVLWQRRKSPPSLTAWGDWDNGLALPPYWAIDEAAQEGFDIMVFRVDKDSDIAGVTYHDNGLGGTRRSVDDVVQRSQDKGLDYSFMSFSGSVEEELSYGPVWLSTNSPDKLAENIRELGMEEYGGAYDPAQSSDDGDSRTQTEEATDGMCPGPNCAP